MKLVAPESLMLQFYYYLDWIPVSAVPIHHAPVTLQPHRIVNQNLDSIFRRKSEVIKHLIRPYVEEIEYSWRTDGLVLFRFAFSQSLSERLQLIRDEFKNLQGDQFRQKLMQVKKDKKYQDDIILLDAIEDCISQYSEDHVRHILSQKVSEETSIDIKRIEGHVDCFHDPTKTETGRRRFLRKTPLQVTNPYEQEFVTDDDQNRQFDHKTEHLGNIIQDDQIVAQISPQRMSSPESRFPALLVMRRDFARIKDDALAAVQLLKEGAIYAAFGRIMTTILTAGLSLSLIWSLLSEPTMTGKWYDWSIQCAVLAFVLTIGYTVIHVFHGYRHMRLGEIVRNVSSETKYWITVLCLVVLAILLPSVVQARVIGLSTTDLIRPFIPMSGIILAVYAYIEVEHRRKDILNVLRVSIGFLSYYHLYSLCVERIYDRINTRQVPGRSTEGFLAAMNTLRIRHEEEYEKLTRGKYLIVSIGAFISAYVAAGAVFGVI